MDIPDCDEDPNWVVSFLVGLCKSLSFTSWDGA